MTFENSHDYSLLYIAKTHYSLLFVSCDSLMRQAYLEIAILYLASSGLVVLNEGSFLESLTSEDESVSSTSKDSTALKRKNKKKKSWKVGNLDIDCGLIASGVMTQNYCCSLLHAYHNIVLLHLLFACITCSVISGYLLYTASINLWSLYLEKKKRKKKFIRPQILSMHITANN